jgi:hypothetical protein
MIGVTENYLRTSLLNLLRVDSLYGTSRAYRHKRRCLNITVRGVKYASPGLEITVTM